MNSIRLLLLAILVVACQSPCPDTQIPKTSQPKQKPVNFLKDVNALNDQNQPQAVIEVPAGTLEKWEVNKQSGRLEWTRIDTVPRVVDYLGYPGNYGMIPKTLLAKASGGDGDPLDVIILGASIDRGTVVPIKILGVLQLVDDGEQDDKLVAVPAESELARFSEISELDSEYAGITQILELWFTNYKGPDQVRSNGFAGRTEAMEILEKSMGDYNAY